MMAVPGPTSHSCAPVQVDATKDILAFENISALYLHGPFGRLTDIGGPPVAANTKASLDLAIFPSRNANGFAATA